MIFDIIADVARTLLDSGEKHFFEEYLAMTSTHREHLKAQIQKAIPNMFISGVQKQLEASDLSVNSKVSKQIIAFITETCTNHNYMALMQLMVTVCDSLLNYIAGLSKLTADFSPFDYLNTNHETTKVIVLPYYGCDWQHDKMRNHFENGINNYINNIYIIDIKYTIGKYKIQNYILNRTLFSRAKKSRKLKIGVSPLTCLPAITRDTIEIEDRNGVGFFSIKEVKNSDIINNTFLSILKKARKEDVDILVFPEMLGTEETKKQFEDFCEKEIFNTELSTPDIVVLPSIWKGRQNIAYVYIGELNKPIVQKKHYRFPYPDNGTYHLEDLDNQETPVINVFHSEHLGRIVVAICKDLLMKEHIEFLIGDLRASLILVPSFSTGDFPFKMISYYGFPYDCHVVWINTCAAEHIMPDGHEPLKTVGMIYNPSKSNTIPSMPTLEKENCDNQCNDCLKTYEVDLKGE